jgi:hypothetical protein
MDLHLKHRRSFVVPYQDFSRISGVFDKRRKKGRKWRKRKCFQRIF